MPLERDFMSLRLGETSLVDSRLDFKNTSLPFLPYRKKRGGFFNTFIK